MLLLKKIRLIDTLRFLLLGLCFFSVFFTTFTKITYLPIFKYFDEIAFVIVIILCLAYFIRTIKIHLSTFFLIVFILYSIIISYLFGFNQNLFDVTLQTFISLKFFIFLTGFVFLFKNKLKYINLYFKVLFGFAFLGILLHLILGTTFNQILNFPTFARPNIRFTGFVPHPNHMAYLAVIYLGYILTIVKVKYESKINFKYLLQIIGCVVILFLTDSRSSIIASLVFFGAFYWDLILKNAMILIYVFVASLVSILALFYFTDIFITISENIEESLTLESTYIRGNIMYLSGLIFYEFFPLGTGSASFGSLMANDKVYEYYDQADRYYFANDIGLYDSNIASIIGEYGFIGVIFFTILFIYFFKFLKNNFGSNTKMLASLFLVFLFYAVTNPMLTNNVYIFISLPVFIKIANVSKKNKS